jgi:hypothetical protein
LLGPSDRARIGPGLLERLLVYRFPAPGGGLGAPLAGRRADPLILRTTRRGI